MQKIILALAVYALVPAVYVAVAYADDDATEIVDSRVVAQRMNCDDINSEMNRLNSRDVLEDADIVRLNELKSLYRTKCVKRAGSRMFGARNRIIINTTNVNETVPAVENVATTENATTTTTEEKTCDTPDENGCCPGESYVDLGDLGFNCCTENNEKCFPPMKTQPKTPGLCQDGAQPDEMGCCTGETYTDLGDLGFNCCMDDGVTCFPPIK